MCPWVLRSQIRTRRQEHAQPANGDAKLVQVLLISSRQRADVICLQLREQRNADGVDPSALFAKAMHNFSHHKGRLMCRELNQLMWQLRVA